jgi:acyl carrier protein
MLSIKNHAAHTWLEGGKIHMSDTFSKVKTLIAAEFQIDPANIIASTRLVDLGIDSLAALEFAFVLEDAFKVTMDAATDLRGGVVQSVVDAVDLALSRQRETEAEAKA